MNSDSTYVHTHTYLDVMRHGACVGGTRFNGSTDVALSDHGWQQMQQTIDQISAQQQQHQQPNWDICISSPRKRCADFAKDISQQLSIPWFIEEDFREIHFGDWEGRSALELMETQEKELGLFWQDPSAFTPTNAEAVSDFAIRIKAARNRMFQKHQHKRILLISHGGVMRCLLCYAHKKPLQDLMSFEVNHAELLRFQLHNNSINLRTGSKQ